MSAPAPRHLINRELSWLAFNQRVLEEAASPAVPLLERLFFLAVAAGNLDEFFMVRAGGLHLQVAASPAARDPAGLTPAAQLARVRGRAHRHVREQYAVLARTVLPGFAAEGLRLDPGAPLPPDEAAACEERFNSDVGQLLTPLAVYPDRPFPLLAPLALYLAVRLLPPAGKAAPGEAAPPLHVLIRLGPGLARVQELPGRRRCVLLEDLVRTFLPRLLPGRRVAEAVAFRVTRNADMAVDEEYAADMADAMSRVLRERRVAPCVRLEHERHASPGLVAWLGTHTQTAPEDRFAMAGPVDLTGLRELRERLPGDALRYPPWTPRPHPGLDLTRPLFAQLARRDVLLATPYEAFDPVLRLVSDAAADPAVLAIKIVLYRVSSSGPIVRALADAAQRGKHVTALIELKARFDEARNIAWARGLEEAGVQVVYGVRGLKTHAKVCLVLRREDDDVRAYLHFGTGNYNEATARAYTDVGLLTCDPALGRDAAAFFHAISGCSDPQPYLKLAQAPVDLRERLVALIDYETDLASKGQPARILAKLNALCDPEIIAALYRASRAGVEVRLGVRGICTLRPGRPGLSDHITVTAVIDRFLEHSRIACFLHGGDELVFLTSADWMPRNLDRRIELLVPVEDAACRRRLLAILRTHLADNAKAWRLLPAGRYERVARPAGQRRLRSQEALCQQAATAARQARRRARTVYEPYLPARGRR